MSISSTEINRMATYTAQERAKTDTLTGAASELTSQDFLNLMLEQLKHQDPLSPVDNAEWMSQQTQISQLQTAQEMNDTLAENATVTQALALMDKHVILENPDDPSKAITGTVDAVCVDGKNTTITVGGKNYPLSSVMYAFDGAASEEDSTASGANSGSSS